MLPILTNAKKTGAALACALFVSAPAALAEEVSGETVLATVGGVEITVGHLVSALQALPPQYQQIDNASLYAGLLDQLIQQNALAQSLPDTLSRETQLGLDNQISGYLAGVALDAATEANVTEESLRALYESQLAEFGGGTEWNAAHILVETEEKAAELKAEIDAGADFAEMAQTHSTGPSGPNGGALGWFGEGMMVPAFEAAVKELETGAVSGPIQTQFGWHLVKLNETRDATAPAFEEVQGDLRELLTEQSTQDSLAAAVAAAEITRADIEVDPSVIRNTDLLQD